MEKYFLSWAELRKQPTRAPPRTTRAGSGPPPLLCHLLEYCPPLHRLQLQIHLFLINRY